MINSIDGAAVKTRGVEWNSAANTALKLSARSWFVVAVAGQWLFAYYMLVFYGGSAASGNMEVINKRLIHGFIDGDFIGNVALAVHLFLAFVITFGGPLQLVPQIRSYAPAFHRWNGRVYIVTAFVISLGALYMVWTRGVLGGTINAIAISINAALIMGFAGMALKYALARNIKIHRRWALRMFLAVSGVWFFRVGFGLWIFLNGGARPWSTRSLDGPFDIFLAFACYLLPLAVLEIYLRTQDRAGPRGKFMMAAGLFVLTAAMGIGIFMAARIFWLPRL